VNAVSGTLFPFPMALLYLLYVTRL